MELAIQQTQSDQRNHTDGCIEGQKRLEKRLEGIDSRIEGMDTKLDGVVTWINETKVATKAAADTRAEMSAPKWWHPYAAWVVRGVIVGACGLILTLATIVLKDRDQIASLQRQPATAVTVNPPAPPVVTQTPQVAQPSPPTVPAPPAPEALPSTN